MKKKLFIIGTIALITVIAIAASILSPIRSKIEFEAVVQETVTQPDGEVRLIV